MALAYLYVPIYYPCLPVGAHNRQEGSCFVPTNRQSTMKTPITQIIDFIINTAATKDANDEVRKALLELSDYMLIEAERLLQVEKEVVSNAFEVGMNRDRDPLMRAMINTQNYGNEYYNETFEPLLITPIVDAINLNKKQTI